MEKELILEVLEAFSLKIESLEKLEILLPMKAFLEEQYIPAFKVSKLLKKFVDQENER